MNTRALIFLSLKPLARKLEAWLLQREITRTTRDLELTKKEIAEKLVAKSILQLRLKHLKKDQPMKPIPTCRAGRWARRWRRFISRFAFLRFDLHNL